MFATFADRTHPRPMRGAGLILLGFLALIAVACGDDVPPLAATSTPVPTATEAATPAPTPAEEPDVAGFPVTVVDSGGEEIVLEAPPQRIISHSPGATEVLFAIGAGAQVVAADEFSDYPAATEQLERVQYSDPDPERALALEPDLIIFGGRQRGSIEQFRSLDLTVFYNAEVESIDALLENILKLGLITGNSEGAEALVASMRERIEAVESALAEVDAGPRVYWEITDDLYTVAPNTFIGDLLIKVKAANIAEGATTAFPQLSSEAVIEANPEVILMANHEWVTLDSLRDRPGWDAIDAVANDRIFPVDSDKSSRPGPRIVEALEELVALLYPDRF
jgi:iron complex transport system substrate-binding protein